MNKKLVKFLAVLLILSLTVNVMPTNAATTIVSKQEEPIAPDNARKYAKDSNGRYYYQIATENYLYGIRNIAGDGDATLITVRENPSKKVVSRTLIDAGNYNTKNTDKLKEFIKDSGIKTIDNVIITHNHCDHIGGLLWIKNNNISVKNLYMNNVNYETPISLVKNESPKSLAASIKKNTYNSIKVNTNIKIINTALYNKDNSDFHIQAGGTGGKNIHIFAGITNLSKLNLSFGASSAWQLNNSSMIVTIETANDRIIFPGDIHYYTMACLTDNKYYGYKDNTTPISVRNEAYYNAINKYIFKAGNKHVVYRISHHANRGTKSVSDVKQFYIPYNKCTKDGKVISFNKSSFKIESDFINKINTSQDINFIFDKEGRIFTSENEGHKKCLNYYFEQIVTGKGVARKGFSTTFNLAECPVFNRYTLYNVVDILPSAFTNIQ